MVALGAIIAVITMVVAQLSWRGWVKGARALLRGEGLLTHDAQQRELVLVDDFRDRLRDLTTLTGARLIAMTAGTRTAGALLHAQLRGDELIVVSNREPYIHENGQDGCFSNASKRVGHGRGTGHARLLGTWIAHGSGNADRSVVDKTTV